MTARITSPQTKNINTLANEILGNDFISPSEIATARGLTYSEEQVTELERILPDKATLEWLHCNDYMLVAGSPREMSLLDIRELNRNYFYSKEGGWYVNKTEAFARDEKVICCWYMIRKGIVPNSRSKTWGEQQPLLEGVEMVPTVVKFVWALTCYKAVRGVYLLRSLHARTSSIDSYGRHVGVGIFDGDGLHIIRCYDNGRDSFIGLSAARK